MKSVDLPHKGVKKEYTDQNNVHSGPVASAFANTYGCRPVTIVGALIAFFGFVLSTASPSIYLTWIAFGLIGGKQQR